eukprot:SAG31_NODE_6315_length_2067_cov_3.583545_1_plen_319_part_00
MLTTEEVWAEEAVGFLLALLCVGRRNYSRLKPARKARIASGQYGWLDAADLLLTLGMAFIVGAFADLIGLVAAELLAAVWTLLRGHGAADLVSGGVVMGTGWYRIQHLFSTRAEAAVSGIILLGIPALATNVLLEALLAPGGGDHPVAVAAVYIVWYLLFERLVLAAADLELAERRRLDTLHSRAGRHDRLADFLASPWCAQRHYTRISCSPRLRLVGTISPTCTPSLSDKGPWLAAWTLQGGRPAAGFAAGRWPPVDGAASRAEVGGTGVHVHLGAGRGGGGGRGQEHELPDLPGAAAGGGGAAGAGVWPCFPPGGG